MSAQLVVTQRIDKILTDLVKKMGTETVTIVLPLLLWKLKGV